MKRIINGFRYDTEKATLIGEASHSGGGDFSAWRAGLYVTPRAKRYFLAGMGGPMTRWGRHEGPAFGGTTSGGEGVIPLSREEALEWAEQHLSTEEIERGFEIEDA